MLPRSGRGCVASGREGSTIAVRVGTEAALSADQYRAVWVEPGETKARTIDFAPHWTGKPWAHLRAGDLADPTTLEVFDDRVIGWIAHLASVQ